MRALYWLGLLSLVTINLHFRMFLNVSIYLLFAVLIFVFTE